MVIAYKLAVGVRFAETETKIKSTIDRHYVFISFSCFCCAQMPTIARLHNIITRNSILFVLNENPQKAEIFPQFPNHLMVLIQTDDISVTFAAFGRPSERASERASASRP